MLFDVLLCITVCYWTIVVDFLPNIFVFLNTGSSLTWNQTSCSSPRQRPGSRRQLPLQLLEFQGQANQLWSSAPTAGHTTRALMVITMIGSTSVLDFTCSSMHFGLSLPSVCSRCICVIHCTKSTMVWSFTYCEEYCASSMVIIFHNIQ